MFKSKDSFWGDNLSHTRQTTPNAHGDTRPLLHSSIILDCSQLISTVLL